MRLAAAHKVVLFAACVTLAWAQDDEGEEGEEKSKREIVAQYAYCMEDNCYELLGVKKDAGALPIKRAYRKLATEWHPDKNPDPRAKSLFQKFANAYEVLSSKDMRDNYDYLLDHPYEFPMHFMRFSRAKYVPKSDLRFVLFLTVVILSAMEFYLKKSKYEMDVKAVKASSRYQERLKQLLAEEFKVGLKKSGGSTKGKSVKGDKADEAREKAEAMLHEEIIAQLVQPTRYQDTLAWKIFVAPLTLYYSGQANLTWFLRFKVKGEEYGPEEKAYLTYRALKIPEEEWNMLYTEKEQEEFVALELWEKANLQKYAEEQEELERSDKASKSAKQKREERQAKKRTGKFVMDE